MTEIADTSAPESALNSKGLPFSCTLKDLPTWCNDNIWVGDWCFDDAWGCDDGLCSDDGVCDDDLCVLLGKQNLFAKILCLPKRNSVPDTLQNMQNGFPPTPRMCYVKPCSTQVLLTKSNLSGMGLSVATVAAVFRLGPTNEMEAVRTYQFIKTAISSAIGDSNSLMRHTIKKDNKCRTQARFGSKFAAQQQ